MTELKPCIWCQALQKDLEITEEETTRIKMSWVHCFRCGARGPIKPTKKQAISSWNKRS